MQMNSALGGFHGKLFKLFWNTIALSLSQSFILLEMSDCVEMGTEREAAGRAGPRFARKVCSGLI